MGLLEVLIASEIGLLFIPDTASKTLVNTMKQLEEGNTQERFQSVQDGNAGRQFIPSVPSYRSPDRQLNIHGT